MDLFLDLLKAYGPPGILAVFLYLSLHKSEERESKKDMRIQLLENQLRESYDERVSAANAISSALYENAKALDSLIGEIRSSRNVQRR